MPYFSDETLFAIRNIPLYEIVRPQVDLTRNGKNWRGLSPFSQEKTPSFYVLTDKNYFKCFSTGLAGDGIRFVQETEKLTFPEALEALAERFNIPVKYAGGSGPDPQLRSRKQGLYDLHEYARDYYHREFMAANEDAQWVRRYWVEQRGFDLDLAATFHIGFAPVAGNGLLELLLEKGFKKDLLAECGLFYANRQHDPRSWFAVFRGRLMIPIRDLQGQVVAFTARQLDLTPQDHGSAKAKYINSPETLIFHKGGMLFNLDRAKDAVKESGRMLMVEGQLDALRCVASGLGEAIAPQGTAVTDAQLSLIHRYTDRLDVLLDSDEPGRRAALRLLPMAFQARLEVGVYQLPATQDPDDFLREHGKRGLEGLSRISGIAFAGQALLPPEPTPESRAKALEGCFQILSHCHSAVVREGYLDDAISATGVPTAAAQSDFIRFFSGFEASPANPPRSVSSAAPRKEAGLLTNVEGDLIWAVLQNVRWADSLVQVVDHQWIRSSTVEGRLLAGILNLASIDHLESIDEIYASLESDDERACFARYRVEERPNANMADTVNKALLFLFKQYCREYVKQLNQEILKLTNAPASNEQVQVLMQSVSEWNRRRLHGPFPRAVAPGISTASISS